MRSYTRPSRIRTVSAAALMTTVGLAGCSGTLDTDPDTTPSLSQETPMEPAPDSAPDQPSEGSTPTGGSAPTSDTSSGSTVLLLEVDGSTISAHVDSSAVAASLMEQLPLTLPVHDFGGQEKVTDLPEPLDLEGAPAGSGAEPGMIGYYAPDQRLILYYEPVGYYNGIIPLGTFDDVPVIENLPDGATLTIRTGE
ncbi:hypothetical protein MN0502_14680 [Arthrobacter sp. MN05-02]|nr:hypothetical protein MN0502_14680 [Arthrobacter sp. MN05-02]